MSNFSYIPVPEFQSGFLLIVRCRILEEKILMKSTISFCLFFPFRCRRSNTKTDELIVSFILCSNTHNMIDNQLVTNMLYVAIHNNTFLHITCNILCKNVSDFSKYTSTVFQHNGTKNSWPVRCTQLLRFENPITTILSHVLIWTK